MGYLVPAGETLGVLPDWQSCWGVAVSRHLEIQVDILAGELFFECSLKQKRPGKEC